jgi:hypothetical protein
MPLPLVICDLWTSEADALCITTNGFVKKNGCAVMGAGVAAQAVKRFPGIDEVLGRLIKNHGNHVHVLTPSAHIGPRLLSFPVKPRTMVAMDGCENVVRHMRRRFRAGQDVPGWACKAQLPLIRRSAKELMWYVEQRGWERVLLPKPGCGAGGLFWHDVRVELEPVIDERVVVVTNA